jgi:hypothetical protein
MSYRFTIEEHGKVTTATVTVSLEGVCLLQAYQDIRRSHPGARLLKCEPISR